MQKQTDVLIGKLRQQRGLTSVSTVFRANIPQLFLEIDRKKVASLGVSFDDLNNTLGIYLGSLYVNSFNEFGRYWQVNLQGDSRFRSRINDINLLYVRNNRGLMVPLRTLVTLREIGGPIFVQRYNLYTAAPITGGLLPGTSSGAAIAEMNALANQTLPRSMGTEWTQLIFLQILEGNTTVVVFALAVLAVFLALSALYESWTLPLAVILVVPMSLLCSLAGVLFAHLSVDIFVQIGLVVLVGLACKNAILIVEFARQLRQEGKPRFEATVEASRLRLRPILDDVVRLHTWRFPSCSRHGGRRRDAPFAGNGGLRRHVRRDAVRHLPDAGVLLRHRWARRTAGVFHPGHAPVRICTRIAVQHPLARPAGALVAGTLYPGSAAEGRTTADAGSPGQANDTAKREGEL